MTNSQTWRDAYRTATLELEPAKKLQLCHTCRQLIQEQMSAPGQQLSERDREAMEEALRSLWIMEEEIRNPKIH